MAGATASLTAAERWFLLDVARRSIQARLRGMPLPEPWSVPQRLRAGMGAFVTLQHAGELRGCIGWMSGERPLWEAVREVAAAAATEDPRFRPLTEEEFPDLSIEISVLSPAVEVMDRDHIAIGRHGLIVTQGNRRGVLLPQVAVEQGWDADTFVRQTCLKAGLPQDACDRGATLEAFEAEVFSEEAPAG